MRTRLLLIYLGKAVELTWNNQIDPSMHDERCLHGYVRCISSRQHEKTAEQKNVYSSTPNMSGTLASHYRYDVGLLWPTLRSLRNCEKEGWIGEVGGMDIEIRRNGR